MSPTCLRPFAHLAAAILLPSTLPLAALAQPYEHVAKTDPLPPEKERATFRLPPGFEAQLVASEPQIQKPINLAFDAKGRLWLTDSVEYPFPVKEGTPGRDRVVILSDFDDSGKARKVQVFADGLNIPIGILPLPGGDAAIVWSIPNVWLLRDTDGDGKADERKVLVSGFGYRDTHGMVNGLRLGFDGVVHANHGFANDSKAKGTDGSTVTMNSGNTFRFRTDGTKVEHFTFGQVNPFGTAFDPFGNVYTADCHSKPITQLLRGAYYDSFGKPHDGLGFGPAMMGHSHDSTALCGLVYYAANHFPEEYQNTMFLGNVTGNRINHDRIEFTGSTPRAVERPAFLTSADPWFRPVDIRLGPDGALYVADFYNRIIGHYEVPLTHPGRDRHRGRIWRIVWKGTDGKAPPPKAPRADWTKATNEELARDLAHPNLTVRLIATHELAARGAGAAEAARAALTEAKNPEQAAHALWVLERLGRLGEEDLAKATAHAAPLVRVHALRILAQRAELSRELLGLAQKALKDAHPLARRCAAEVIGRHPDSDPYIDLVKLRVECPDSDTHLTHAVRIAMRDALRARPELFNAVTVSPGEGKLLKVLAEVALALPTPEAAAQVWTWLNLMREVGGTDLYARGLYHLARYGEGRGAIDGNPDKIADALDELRGKDLGVQLAGFRAIHRATQDRGVPFPEEGVRRATEQALAALRSDDPGKAQLGIELAATLRLAGLRDPLTDLLRREGSPMPRRLAACQALASIDPGHATGVLAKLLTNPGEPAELRQQAARALAAVNREPARKQLVEALAVAPAVLAREIAAGLATTPEGGEALLAAIKEGKASARLLQEQVVVNRLRERRLPRVNERIAELTRGIPSADAKLLELIGKRRDGFRAARPDPALGAKVFEKNCAICHQLGGQGSKVGPQLDGIGARGLERLLEDVLDPSRNVDQALRTTNIELQSGRVLSGLVLREEGEVIVLADAEGKEVRVPKSEVAERIVSPLSPMPADVGEKIAEKDFYDLIGYLLTQRAKEEPPPGKSGR